MAELITAIYEQGVLRPLRPLNLAENVVVSFYLLPEPSSQERDEIIQLLVKAGLMRPSLKPLMPPALNLKERQLFAQQLGQATGKPLSEIVIEERGPR